jgi:hypothetical protein
VLLGAGIVVLPRWPRAVLAGVFLVLSCLALWNYFFVPEYWKEDVRGPTRYIEEHERPGDVVLVPVVLDVFDYYYRGRVGRFALYPGEVASDEAVGRLIDDRVGSAKRLWFIDARLWGVDPDRRIPAYLTGRYRLIDAKEFRGARLFLFDAGGGEDPERADAPPSWRTTAFAVRAEPTGEAGASGRREPSGGRGGTERLGSCRPRGTSYAV